MGRFNKKLFLSIVMECLGVAGITILTMLGITDQIACWGIASLFAANVSGALFNPWHTLILILTKNISWVHGLFYIGAQFLGGITGAGLIYWTFGAGDYNENDNYDTKITFGIDSDAYDVENMRLPAMRSISILFFIYGIASIAWFYLADWIHKPGNVILSTLAIALITNTFTYGQTYWANEIEGRWFHNPAVLTGAIIYEKDLFWEETENDLYWRGGHVWIHYVSSFTAACFAYALYFIFEGSLEVGKAMQRKGGLFVPAVAPSSVTGAP